jgi:hypothetical protein
MVFCGSLQAIQYIYFFEWPYAAAIDKDLSIDLLGGDEYGAISVENNIISVKVRQRPDARRTKGEAR